MGHWSEVDVMVRERVMTHRAGAVIYEGRLTGPIRYTDELIGDAVCSTVRPEQGAAFGWAEAWSFLVHANDALVVLPASGPLIIEAAAPR